MVLRFYLVSAYGIYLGNCRIASAERRWSVLGPRGSRVVWETYDEFMSIDLFL